MDWGDIGGLLASLAGGGLGLAVGGPGGMALGAGLGGSAGKALGGMFDSNPNADLYKNLMAQLPAFEGGPLDSQGLQEGDRAAFRAGNREAGQMAQGREGAILARMAAGGYGSNSGLAPVMANQSKQDAVERQGMLGDAMAQRAFQNRQALNSFNQQNSMMRAQLAGGLANANNAQDWANSGRQAGLYGSLAQYGLMQKNDPNAHKDYPDSRPFYWDYSKGGGGQSGGAAPAAHPQAMQDYSHIDNAAIPQRDQVYGQSPLVMGNAGIGDVGAQGVGLAQQRGPDDYASYADMADPRHLGGR